MNFEGLEDLDRKAGELEKTKQAYYEGLGSTWMPFARVVFTAANRRNTGISYGRKAKVADNVFLLITGEAAHAGSDYFIELFYKRQRFLRLGINCKLGTMRIDVNSTFLPEYFYFNDGYLEQLMQAYQEIKSSLHASIEKEQYEVDRNAAQQDLHKAQLVFEKRIKEAEITGETLTHTIHTEDLLTGGSKAADFALTALYAVYDMLQGSTPKEQVNVTCKWDGAPSVAAATNFHGKKFVATKGFFAKDRKIAYTEEDCDRYFGHAPDLAKKLKLLLGLLDEIQIPADQIWQGDFLFDKDSLKVESIDGDRCVTFHPNTIVYAVPANDPLARAMQAATVGVVWHTRYRGEDFDTLKISFDANADELSSTSNAFCMDARLPSIAGKITLTEDETHKIHALLEEATSLVEDCKASGSLDQVASDEELQLYLNTFENYVIKSRMQQLDKSPSDYLKELREWVVARYDKEIAAKKQPKTQQAYIERKEQALARIDELMPELVKIVQAQKLVVAIKEFFIAKLNRAGSFKTLFKAIDKGFVPTGHEGYAISDINGNIQKFVSRLEFSYGNFSKDIVKGWMSDKRAQESAKLSAESFLREKMTVPELKQTIISATQTTNDTETLVKAYNALNKLDVEALRAALKPRFEIPSTLDRVASALESRRPAIENEDYIKLIAAIAQNGVISLQNGATLNFKDEAIKNCRMLAKPLGIEFASADAVINTLFDNLLYDSFPQNGIVVGAGEILFALLVKNGAKRSVGDLSIGNSHVEVKGIAARLVGASGQGGLRNKPSIVGGQIRRYLKEAVPGISEELLSLSTALDIYANGPLLLVDAISKALDKREVASRVIEMMLSLLVIPAGSSRPAEMLSAMLAGNWLEFRNAFLKLNYEAYSAAAGWEKLLVFNGKQFVINLTESVDAFIDAVMRGEIAIKPFSFSAGTKGEGAELLSGFGMTAMPRGTPYREVESNWIPQAVRDAKAAEKALAKKLSSEKRQAAIAAKRAQVLATIDQLKNTVAKKEKLLSTITAPAKRATAQRVLDSSKKRLAQLEQELGK